MKILIVVLHLLVKLGPFMRQLDIASLGLPLKIAVVEALSLRDVAGLQSPRGFFWDIVMLSLAAALTGLLLWPKSPQSSGAGQE